MNDLRDIILALKETCEETGISPSEDVLFEQAMKYLISNNIARDKALNHTPQEIKKAIRGTPATEKQKKLLTSLGVQFDSFLTKKQAFDMIQARYGK